MTEIESILTPLQEVRCQIELRLSSGPLTLGLQVTRLVRRLLVRGPIFLPATIAASIQANPAANAATPHQMYGGEYANVIRCVPAVTVTAWNRPANRSTRSGLPS